MKLSTKSRYAVHALVDIVNEKRICAQIEEATPISLIDISDRQNISRTYLEQIFVKLRQAKIVNSIRGQGGGYVLSRSAREIYISEIIDAVDEPIKITKCEPSSKVSCQGKTSRCLTHNLWLNLDDAIRSYLSNISLADVLDENVSQPFAKDGFRSLSPRTEAGVV